jgi:hypothetical protein
MTRLVSGFGCRIDRIEGAAAFVEYNSIEFVDGFVATVEAELRDAAVLHIDLDGLTLEKHVTAI